MRKKDENIGKGIGVRIPYMEKELKGSTDSKRGRLCGELVRKGFIK